MQVDPEQISTPPDGQRLSAQPTWRQDFPIDVGQDNYVERREFTKFLILTSGAFVVGQAWIAGKAIESQESARPAPRKVADLADIPIGGSFIFFYPVKDEPCILLRPSRDKLLAYSQKCTHLSCAVVPDVEHNRLHCPCHEGNFDMTTGRPLSGPPRRPLPLVHVELRGEEIWATGVEARTV